MCTLVILRRPEHDWPLIVAANRDEKLDRPTLPPGRHWPDRDNVVAGKDVLAGGTWLGVNDDGIVSGILNRTGTLGPDPDLRSRGELPLEALDHAEAEAVAAALFDLDPHAYRPFNLFVGDSKDAFWISSLNEYGEPGMRLGDIPMGISMLTDKDLNDGASPRVMRYLAQFGDADEPVLNEYPTTDNWSAWQTLLSSKAFEAEAGPSGAMNIDRGDDFGTVSSSLIALPSPDLHPAKLRWLYADGPPDKANYETVQI